MNRKSINNNNITIKDIAQELKVSTATVSMSLSGKGNISTAVRENILNTAKEMGYKFNKLGSALVMKNVTIGVMIPRQPSVIQQMLYQGITDGCSENSDIKYKCIIMEYDYDIKDEERCLKVLCSCDGIIIEFDSEREEPHKSIIEKINQKNIPVVSLVVRPVLLKTTAHVSVDAETVGSTAADILNISLRERQFKEVVLFSGCKDADIHRRNIKGFSKACMQYGLQFKKVVYTNDEAGTVAPLLKGMLEKYPDLSGIFVSSYLAHHICRELKELKPMNNIAIVGVDMYKENIDYIRDGSLNAVIHQQQQLQGKMAFNELISQLLNSNLNTHNYKTIQISGRIITFGGIEAFLSDINGKPAC